MLRHIISVSLAMTACATFMPTKASAATLTASPIGEIEAMSGDSVEFSYELTPSLDSVITILSLFFTRDVGELSNSTGGTTIAINSIITGPKVIGTRTYNVLTPQRDEEGDVGDAGLTITYEESGPSGTATFEAFAVGADVVPVPEPLTIFGTATALGCGALFKRKSSKKTVS